MKSNRKQYVGEVLSNKMEKTVVVGIRDIKMHALYKKSVRITKRVKSHDHQNQCSIGDIVKIEECRPLSKDKRYRLIEIVEKSK